MKDPKDPTQTIPVKLKYGAFIQAIIDFLIIAACLFGMIQVRMPRPSEYFGSPLGRNPQPIEEITATGQLQTAAGAAAATRLLLS